MKAVVEQKPGRISFTFERDDDDDLHIQKQAFSMSDEEIYFSVPESLGQVHPDLIGLATILLCNPFVSERLILPLPTSRKFFQEVSSVISKYEVVERVDENLTPIEINNDGKPGLCFSGGADSAAALSIMPGRTIPIFLNRPMRKVSQYDSSAPLAICELLARSGFNIQVVESNLEYIRIPIGFPTDLANAIPAILLSQYLELDSIAFGTVLESGFGLGHEKYVDYGKGAHFKFYRTIFSSVGIGLNLPILGISEVGTGRMGLSSPIASISQSCIRGKWKKPCKNCWKCFRKILLSKAISEEEVDPEEIERMLKRSEVQIRLSSFPISHENVVTYSLQRIDLNKSKALLPLAAKLNMGQELGFLERWFSESIDFIPDKYRNFIRSQILESMEPANYEDTQRIREWDMGPHLSSSRTIRANDMLINHWQNLQ